MRSTIEGPEDTPASTALAVGFNRTIVETIDGGTPVTVQDVTVAAVTMIAAYVDLLPSPNERAAAIGQAVWLLRARCGSSDGFH